MIDIDTLMAEWMQAKAIEAQAIADRRKAEDELVKALGVDPAVEGIVNKETGLYKAKIDPRIDRKVNADKLIDLAAEHGLNAHLGTLFRWTPEINLTAWRAADKSVTQPLSEAITVKAGRPSFKITPITPKE